MDDGVIIFCPVDGDVFIICQPVDDDVIIYCTIDGDSDVRFQ